MLSDTCRAFYERLEYTKSSDGSWTAEFNGAIHVLTTASSLERCRSRALDELDKQLAAWIAATGTGNSPQHV